MICSSEGDAGDITYALCLLKELGGSHTLLLQQSARTKARGVDGISQLHRLVGPLASAQPYISECRVMIAGEKIDWQSALFRNQGHYRQGETLMEAHRKNLEATTGLGSGITGKTRWLDAPADKSMAGKVVVNRTGRYRNQYFPWMEVVAHYGHRLVFVGLKHEWREFCGHFGYVDFRPTSDLLEVASLIAGSSLFIGNQSSPFAVAEGLKHPRILEMSMEFPDTVFGGDNVQYVADGTAVLPDVAGSGERRISSKAFNITQVNTLYIPRGGWQYNSEATGPVMTSSLDGTARKIKGKLGLTQQQAEAEVIKQNVLREPRHFARYMQMPDFSRARAALQAAGVTDHPLHEIAKGNIQFTT